MLTAPPAPALTPAYAQVGPNDPGAMLVFRGLRVRMGINSGIYSAADCKPNKAAGRMHYTGGRARALDPTTPRPPALCAA